MLGFRVMRLGVVGTSSTGFHGKSSSSPEPAAGLAVVLAPGLGFAFETWEPDLLASGGGGPGDGATPGVALSSVGVEGAGACASGAGCGGADVVGAGVVGCPGADAVGCVVAGAGVALPSETL